MNQGNEGGTYILKAVGKKEWWAYLESNQGPHAYQACALTV